MRVTILRPNVFDTFGRAMLVGSTYTVADEFGKSLVQALQASDTDSVLTAASNPPYSLLPVPAAFSAASGATLTLNIASRGEVPIGDVTVSNPTTRYKGRRAYVIRTAATRIKFVYANRRLTNSGEQNSPGAASIRKVSAEVSGVTTAATFYGGSRSVVLAAGQLDLTTDWINVSVNPGDTVYHRCSVDFTTAGYVSDYRVNAEQSWLYNPTNDVDDVDGTGSMTQPSGASTAFPFHPLYIIAETPAGAVSYIGVGDSIVDGLADLGGDLALPNQLGNGGGGFVRRAMWGRGLAYTSFAQSGRTLDASSSTNTLLASMLKYHTHMIQQLGTNSLDTVTVASQKTRYQTVWTLGRNNLVGPKRIIQVTMLPKVTSTAGCTTVVSQTPVTDFAANGKRDQIHSWFREQLSTGIDSLIDVSKAVEEPTDSSRWAASTTLNTTLAALCASNASSISINAVPLAGETLSFDPGGANNSNGFACVLSVSGLAAPFTATLAFSPGVAQSNGATVKSTLTADGTHPGGTGNRLMAEVLARSL